jgi:hypothetical protein
MSTAKPPPIQVVTSLRFISADELEEGYGEYLELRVFVAS